MTRTLVVLLTLCHGALPRSSSRWLAPGWSTFRPACGSRTVSRLPSSRPAHSPSRPLADSLIGTLATNPAPDMPARPPMRLAAKASTGEATFVAHSKATINVNGAEHEANVVSTWVLRAKGDSLVGTVARKIDSPDAGPQEPRPVTGTRKKG